MAPPLLRWGSCSSSWILRGNLKLPWSAGCNEWTIVWLSRLSYQRRCGFYKATWKPGSHVWTPEDRLMSKLSFRWFLSHFLPGSQISRHRQKPHLSPLVWISKPQKPQKLINDHCHFEPLLGVMPSNSHRKELPTLCCVALSSGLKPSSYRERQAHKAQGTHMTHSWGI